MSNPYDDSSAKIGRVVKFAQIVRSDGGYLFKVITDDDRILPEGSTEYFTENVLSEGLEIKLLREVDATLFFKEQGLRIRDLINKYNSTNRNDSKNIEALKDEFSNIIATLENRFSMSVNARLDFGKDLNIITLDKFTGGIFRELLDHSGK